MSNFDPRKTVDTPATNPNRGMNTRTYMTVLLVALVLLLLGVLFFTMRPGPGQAPKPSGKMNSQISVDCHRLTLA